jgi:DNA-binding CsgD family transcriptional regulator
MSANTNSVEELNNKIALLEAELSQLMNKNKQTTLFIDKILNSLPGIFYLYEKSGDTFLLKKWNKNHVTLLGYSDDELFNKRPEDFFDEENVTIIEKGLTDIFSSKGSVQVKADILTKSNQKIPYLFEGYYFEDRGNLFFLGVGMDISMQSKIQSDMMHFVELSRLQKIEKSKLNEQLQLKKRELVAYALEISKTRDVVSEALKNMSELQTKYGDNLLLSEVNLLLHNMEKANSSNLSWETFMQQFTEIHRDFFTTLKEICPALTKSELKFCALLRIQMSSAQIASALNVTSEAIKKTRYRIRKKIELDSKASLEDYLLKI